MVVMLQQHQQRSNSCWSPRQLVVVVYASLVVVSNAYMGIRPTTLERFATTHRLQKAALPRLLPPRLASSHLSSTLEKNGRLSSSSSDSTPLEPTLEMLQTWTEEFFDDMEDSGGWSGIDGYAHYFDDAEFVHTGPSFGPVNKEDLVAVMRYNHDNGLDFSQIVPDLSISVDGWHIDPHNPWRIWVIVRYSGTHTATARLASLGGLELAPSKENYFMTGPELHSFHWTPEKKIRWQTAGFVGDQHTGSNEGYGGILGILISLGLPRLSVDTIVPFTLFPRWLSQFWNNNKRRKEGQQMTSTPRAKTPYSKLPQWWHDRKKSSMNICR